MAVALPYITAAVAVGGAAYSISKQQEAARQQERSAIQAENIGRENAAVIEAETREQVKRQKLADASQGGKARAIAAASGVKTTGSVGSFLEDLTAAQKDSLSWLSRSGEQRSRIAQLSGEYTAGQGRAAAQGTKAASVGTGVQGVSTVFNVGSTQNWWS